MPSVLNRVLPKTFRFMILWTYAIVVLGCTQLPSSLPTTQSSPQFVVSVVDQQGKPIDRAKIGVTFDCSELQRGVANTSFTAGGTFVRWGGTPNNLPIMTRENGSAQLPTRPLAHQLYGVDESRGLVALISLDNQENGIHPLISSLDSSTTVKMVAVPACSVSGSVTCPWINERKWVLNESYAYVGWGKSDIVLSFTSSRNQFQFLLPPGKYSLRVGGNGRGVGRAGTGGIPLEERSLQFEVKSGQRELNIGPLELGPTALGKLVGMPAPDVQGMRFPQHADFHSLGDLKGQYILLEFWSKDCGSCPQSLRYLLANFDGWKKRGIKVIALHNYDSTVIDSTNFDSLLTTWATKYWDGAVPGFAIAMDLPDPSVDGGGDGAAYAAYHVTSWPTAVLIDSNGIIVHVFTGFVSPEVLNEITTHSK